MSNKYKQPSTGTTFRANYEGIDTNPEENWIRSESLFGSGKKKTDNSHSQFNVGVRSGVKVGNKSAEDMMQDMLRGVSHKEALNPYYSKESQGRLAGLLTNEYKRNSYIHTLQTQLPQLQPNTAKNYKLLMLLLEEVAKNDIEVKSGTEGLRIDFNQKVLDNQQILLEKLRREKQAREEEEHRVIKQYEGIIADLQKITEKLVGSPEQAQSNTKP